VQERLDALLAGFDFAAHRERDPVSFVHRANPADREVVALLAALLAFGNVVAVRRSIGRALDRLGDEPARAIDGASERALARKLDRFVHRVWRGDDFAAMLARAGRVRREHGSLGAAFASHLERTGDLRESLARLSDSLRGRDPSRGLAHLVSDPRAGSACKRSLLLLRWMVRPADGVDLGLWPVDPALLVIPVDTHVQRIARNLGLTRRRDASWRTAEDITTVLRRFDAHDPVKYDFAICHLGVSRRCPSRRDPVLCADCVLRSTCSQWRSGEGRGEALL
jgi:uncharacterized protein (TIGR02757 family)